jgi:hypothetical protein
MDCLLVTRIEDQVVGLARLVRDRSRTARLISLRVAPEWCHTAVPRRLIQSIREYCRSHGGLTLEWEASVAPPWMLRLLSSSVPYRRDDDATISKGMAGATPTR